MNRSIAIVVIAVASQLAPAIGTAQVGRFRALVTTSEVRAFFGVRADTLPAAQGDTATIARHAAVVAWHGTFQVDTSCTRAFDAATSWLVYMADGCRRGAVSSTTEDGDALVQVSRDGRRVERTLLNPGGIELLPE